MTRLFTVLACAAALLFSGCSKKEKEIPASVKAEARMLAEEAQFAMSIREHARAEELMQRAVNLHEDMPAYWVSLGVIRLRLDDKKGARGAYEKALKLHAGRYKKSPNPDDLADQAYVTAMLGRTEDAMKLLEKGVKAHPDSQRLKKMSDPRGLPATVGTDRFKELMI